MSQNFEDSPVSDNRMDISETTTSQESTGVSPTDNEYTTTATKTTIDDKKTKSNNPTTNNSSINKTLYSNTISTTAMMIANNKNNDCDNDGNSSDVLKLDNESSSNVLRLGRQQPQQNLRSQTTNCNSLIRASELKVANSHPLMSPQGSTDSDSENNSYHHHNHSHHTNKHRIFSYPDVVPQNEPLRLVNNTTTGTTTAISSPITKQLMKNQQQNLDVTSDCTTKQNTTVTGPISMTATATTTTTIDKSSDRILVIGNSQKRKISVRRESSPDLISSESDQDISQYQASVEPNYQSVTLISNNLNRTTKTMTTTTTTTTQLSPSNKPLTRRKIPIPTDLLSDDMSSLDSISNHSFDDDDDDDMEHNLASLSPSSSVLDGFNDKYDDFPEIETPTNVISPPIIPDPIPQYSAEEERRDSRNWQKITLPDGRIREIDMKVIEPYKRVLSHGGYLKAGGHNAIVMFCACHLPDRSRADYHYVMDNLFLYVVKTLEQLVTEDYVLIYLHGGSSRRNVPPFPWLKKCYQLLDRRLRKSLKNLYLVHPSFWLKSVVWMSRPFVSSKFWRKLVYVRSLEELYTLVSVEKAAIPDKVKQYDAKYS